MATLALFAVGSAIGSSAFGAATIAGVSAAALTGAAFAAAGSYIDSQFIFPALFKQSSNFQGPKLDDLSLQTASEGSPVHRLYGHKNKVAGQVIWISDLIEETSTQSSGGGKGGGGGSVTSTTYRYYVNIAIMVCDHAVDDIVRIQADTKTIYSNGNSDHRTESITVYKGSLIQDPDPLIESYEGAGEVPAFRGKTYVVIERLALADFGNRVPNFLFTVSRGTQTVGEVISTILDEAGVPSVEYDVSELSSDTCRGYVLTGPTPVAQSIEPLMVAFDISTQLRDGKIVFFNSADAAVIEVDEDDLAASQEQQATQARLTITDIPSYDLPTEIDVRFIDQNRAMEQGSTRARRLGQAVQTTEVITLPITMTTTEANKIAKRRLWRSWQERRAATLALPPSYMTLLEADILSVPFEGETYSIRVSEMNTGANGLLEITGVVVDSEAGDVDADSEESGYEEGGLYAAPDLLLFAVDGPALVESHISTPGYYYAICTDDYGVEWLGSTLFESNDATTYTPQASVPIQATLGVADTTLSSTAKRDLIDRANTVDVTLHHGTLSSVTYDQLIAGANRAFIGNELIGFQTATQIGTNQYRLSSLIRGLRDTSLTHGASEKFVLLDSISVGFSAENTGSIGTTKTLKAVPTGLTVLDVTSQDVDITGSTCRGFAPGHLRASRDFTTNDWTITWLRRSRLFGKLFDVIALEEPFEEYEVEILDGSTVVRTFTGVNALTVTYTSAMQIADFGSNQSTLRVKVYQITNLLGRGTAANRTF